MTDNDQIDYKSIYYPGKLVILANEFFNKQKIVSKVSLTQYSKIA